MCIQQPIGFHITHRFLYMNAILYHLIFRYVLLHFKADIFLGYFYYFIKLIFSFLLGCWQWKLDSKSIFTVCFMLDLILLLFTSSCRNALFVTTIIFANSMACLILVADDLFNNILLSTKREYIITWFSIIYNDFCSDGMWLMR